MSLYRVILHSLDNHGVAGTVSRIFSRLLRRSQPESPSGAAADQPHPFDLLHSTDTGGYIPGERLDSGSRSDLYNTAYYGISPSTLTQALSRIDLPPDTTFVDLGCGKGRALLVASSFPFAHLLGVDLSPDLCAIARANAARLALAHATIQQQDAATLTYPDSPLVVFLYHPFLAPVLRRVLANLEQQRKHSPHATWLLYANPQYPRILAATRSLQPVWDHIFQLSPEDAAADRHGTTNERFALFAFKPAGSPRP